MIILTGSVKKIYIDMDSKRRELLVTNEMSYVVWDKIIKRDLLLNNNIVFPEGLLMRIYIMERCFMYMPDELPL